MALSRRAFFRNAAGLLTATTAGVAAVGGHRASDAAPAKRPIRPPGALPERQFLASCIRCQRCVDACPNLAIQPQASSAGPVESGTPHVLPREQACMLCSQTRGSYLRCTAACPTGALQPITRHLDVIRRKVKMGVAVIDFNLCYSYNNYTCGTCYHACPLQGEAIEIGLWERPRVNPDACIGCGLCERACIRYPQAIRVVPRARGRQESRREVSG